jgi:hypothetical protein
MHLTLSKRSIGRWQPEKWRRVLAAHIGEYHDAISAREDVEVIEV